MSYRLFSFRLPASGFFSSSFSRVCCSGQLHLDRHHHHWFFFSVSHHSVINQSIIITSSLGPQSHIFCFVFGANMLAILALVPHFSLSIPQ